MARAVHVHEHVNVHVDVDVHVDVVVNVIGFCSFGYGYAAPWLSAGLGRCGRLPYASLEAEDEAGGWLCGVRGHIRIQRRQPKVRPVVYQPAIFGTQIDVIRELEVGASAIYERCLRLTLCSRDEASGIACWVKFQCSDSRQSIRPQPDNTGREGQDQRARGLMYVGLKIRLPGRRDVLERIPNVSVARIRCQPPIEVEAITGQESARVCRML